MQQDTAKKLVIVSIETTSAEYESQTSDHQILGTANLRLGMPVVCKQSYLCLRETLHICLSWFVIWGPFKLHALGVWHCRTGDRVRVQRVSGHRGTPRRGKHG